MNYKLIYTLAHDVIWSDYLQLKQRKDEKTFTTITVFTLLRFKPT